MSEDYSKTVVKMVVAQICKSLGWDAISKPALDVVVSLAERHMLYLGKTSRRYAEQFGRLDPTMDDLEMAMNDASVSLKDMMDYMKNVESFSLPQAVTKYPAPCDNKLIYPDMDEELTPPDSMNQNKNSQDMADDSSVPGLPGVSGSPNANHRKSISPTRTPSKTRFHVDVDNRRLRAKNLSLFDSQNLDALWNLGKQAARGRPPKPPQEDVEDKIITEPIFKPVLKILKPKPTPRASVDEVPALPPAPEPVPSPTPTPPPVSEDKPKKKKRKKPPAQQTPGGFNDIFGTPLEKPTPSYSKSKTKHLSEPFVYSDGDDDELDSAKTTKTSVSDKNTKTSADISDINTSVKSSLDNLDDTINAVLASTRKDIENEEAATDAFSFDDNIQVTPPVVRKSSSKSKKLSSPSKSRSRSRSPISRPSSKKSMVDDTIDDVLKMGAGGDSKTKQLELSPTASEHKHGKHKKDKKNKKSRREKLLEKFAAAPIESFTPLRDKQTSPMVTPDRSEMSNDEPNLITPPFPVTPRESYSDVNEKTNPSDDEEAGIVNVDEDSDVDVLGASSPTPPPANPYSSYQAKEQTNIYETVVSPNPQPAFNSYQESEPEAGVWEGYTQQVNSQTIDFGSTTTDEKKEKHKKEKKEKKEKKKKKHKERDKDKTSEAGSKHGGKHKHKHRDKSSTLIPESHDEESRDSIPKLTLKLGGQNVPADSPSSNLDDTDEMINMETEEVVPKLVIKPFGTSAGIDYLSSGTGQIASHTVTEAGYVQPLAEAVPVVAEDGKVWICPACRRPDDGSPMIGCDSCDEWFHWPCVGIVQQPPDDVEWYCPTCAKKDKKKKKKKKKDKHKQ